MIEEKCFALNKTENVAVFLRQIVLVSKIFMSLGLALCLGACGREDYGSLCLSPRPKF